MKATHSCSTRSRRACLPNPASTPHRCDSRQCGSRDTQGSLSAPIERRRRRGKVGTGITVLAMLLAISVFSGCGGSTKTTADETTTAGQAATGTQASTPTTTAGTSSGAHTTPAQEPERTPSNEKIVLSSPGLSSDGELGARYTCDGQDVPLTLEWEGVPAGTAELMVDVMKVKSVNDKLQFVWAVTHIPPTSHGLVDGRLPAGAITGMNSDGGVNYDLCPPKGANENYVAAIFSLPHKLGAKPGFDARALRHEAEQQASYQKLLVFSYTRH